MPEVANERKIVDYMTNLPSERVLFWMREAGLSAPLPNSIHRMRRGDYDAKDRDHAIDWAGNFRNQLAPAIFRVVDPPDSDVAELMPQKYMPFNVADYNLELRFDLIGSLGKKKKSPYIRLTDLAAASTLLSELFIDIASANYALGIEIEPPLVKVGSGSVQFTTSGTLLAAGISLIIACSSGLITVPFGLGYVGGALLSGAGTIDTFLGWQKSAAERDKLKEETQKLKAEKEKLQEETKRIKYENQQVDLFETPAGKNLKHRSALSSTVSKKEVAKQAKKVKIPEPYANHLLNRTMGSAISIQKYTQAINYSLKPRYRKTKNW